MSWAPPHAPALFTSRLCEALAPRSQVTKAPVAGPAWAAPLPLTSPGLQDLVPEVREAVT